MNTHITEEEGYTDYQVNIDCLRGSTLYNVIMDLDESVEDLLPWIAATLPGCTYMHGSGVVDLMDESHIIGLYKKRLQSYERQTTS